MSEFQISGMSDAYVNVGSSSDWAVCVSTALPTFPFYVDDPQTQGLSMATFQARMTLFNDLDECLIFLLPFRSITPGQEDTSCIFYVRRNTFSRG